MNDYNLKPGELVVLQEPSVRLFEGSSEESLDELVLTDKSLILVASEQRGLFRRERMLKRCPLERIRRSQGGAPQALVTKIRDKYYLQVAFDDETVVLSFPANPKRGAERWARSICLTADGNPSAVQERADFPPELTNIVDGAKDLVGSFFGGAGGQVAAKVTARESELVTTRCVGCHAPITGKRGTTATCGYCDTPQTL